MKVTALGKNMLCMMCTAGVALFSYICNGSSMLLEGWEFSRDGKSWERVRIPHDWAITGEFNRTNDLQHVMIVQDGERIARDHTGRTGGLPWVGEGWYRRLVSLPENVKEAELVFDGAMSNPTVLVIYCVFLTTRTIRG